MSPQKYRCTEANRVQIKLSGKVGLCCLLPNAFHPIDKINEEKIKLNQMISDGDFSICGKCPNIFKVEEDASMDIHSIDIYTNTLCPGRCFYCAYTSPGSMPPDLVDPTIPSVAQQVNIDADLVGMLDQYIKSPAGKSLRAISLSGGDSAFSPDFERLVELIQSYQLKAVYLSFGLLPQAKEDFVVRMVGNKTLDLSISIDATTAETWEKVKKRPAKHWDTVVNFIDRACGAGGGEGVYIKFIINKMNYREAEAFLPYWFARGVRNFSISGMHVCTPEGEVNFCSPEEYAQACAVIKQQFDTLAMGPNDRVALSVFDGLEVYFPHTPMYRSYEDEQEALRVG